MSSRPHRSGHRRRPRQQERPPAQPTATIGARQWASAGCCCHAYLLACLLEYDDYSLLSRFLTMVPAAARTSRPNDLRHACLLAAVFSFRGWGETTGITTYTASGARRDDAGRAGSGFTAAPEWFPGGSHTNGLYVSEAAGPGPAGRVGAAPSHVPFAQPLTPELAWDLLLGTGRRYPLRDLAELRNPDGSRS